MASSARALRLVLLGALALAPARALADPSAADRETARAMMDEGKTKMAAKDFAAALKVYKAADAIMRVPTTGLAVARAYVALGQLIEARDAARAVAFLPVAKREPPVFAEARTAADQLATSLAPRIPSLQISLAGAGAAKVTRVTIDDAEVPAESLAAPRKIDPGHHVVSVAEPTAARVEVDVAEGEQKSAVLDVAAPPAPPPPPVAAAPPPPAKKKSPLLWIGIGVGAAGLAVGGVAGVVSLGAKSDATAGCVDHKCPPSTYSDLDKASTWATVSTIGFAVAGAGAVVAVLGALGVGGRAAAPQPTTGLVLVPYLAPGAAGVHGAF